MALHFIPVLGTFPALVVMRVLYEISCPDKESE